MRDAAARRAYPSIRKQSGRTTRLLCALSLLLLAACGGDDIRDAQGHVVTEGPWSVFDLRPGDCIGDTSQLAGDVDTVPLVPCDEPHTQEVFALFLHPDDAYPGPGPVATFADFSCLQALETIVGPTATSKDGLAFSYLLPTESGWTNDGDRTIICVLIFPDDAPMTGSFVDGTADRTLLGMPHR